jgi:DNA repair exonuclease SbcCD ATPase subunit
MTFEYLTPEEAANFTPEEAEWEEAALKREAAEEQQALAERIQELTAQLKANARTMEGILERLQEREGPNLVLVETKTSDDA